MLQTNKIKKKNYLSLFKYNVESVLSAEQILSTISKDINQPLVEVNADSEQKISLIISKK